MARGEEKSIASIDKDVIIRPPAPLTAAISRAAPVSRYCASPSCARRRYTVESDGRPTRPSCQKNTVHGAKSRRRFPSNGAARPVRFPRRQMPDPRPYRHTEWFGIFGFRKHFFSFSDYIAICTVRKS